jgi:hypothetical protein
MNKKSFTSKIRSFPQARRLMVIGLLLVFLVSACENATQVPTAESVIDQVQTTVAETITAQITASATPTAAPSPTPTPTAYIFPTTIPATATSQVTYWNYSTYYGCEDSDFIKDVTIPDDTVFAPGETFVKTWKFKNTGTCKWTDDYSIAFINGDDMDGSNTEIDTSVSVNKRAEISVSLTAPDDEGTYVGYWQLMDPYGNTFGDIVYVEIVVAEATATPTSTPTYTATYTPTPTYASTATSTPTPTPIFIDVPTATDTPTPTPGDEPVSTDTPTPTPTEVPTSEPTATLIE